MLLPLLTAALAAPLVAWVPEGVVHVGERSRVGLVCVGCAGPLEGASVEVVGAVVLGTRAGPDGVLYVDVGGPVGEALQFSVSQPTGRITARVPVVPLEASALTLVVPPELAIADGALRVRVLTAGDVAPEDVVLRSSEGTVGPLERTAEGLAATVTLAADRIARPLVLGALDVRAPGVPPAFATVRLRARHSGTVSAEKGTRLSLKIGGRSYGPFVAGADGAAAVSFEALPGESSYELLVTDDLGNTQRLTQAVPAATRPALIAVEGPGRTGGELWLSAADPRGAPWAGPAPACRAGAAAPAAAAEVGRARWRWSPTDDRLTDAPAGCTMGEAAVTTRVPGASRLPAAIALRFYPDVLSADFPLAEVQASLIDESGDRLPPTGLELTAAHGTLRLTAAEDALRGDYDGTAAAALGQDEIRARWSLPSGDGSPQRILVCSARTPTGEVQAVARVLDRLGRPLVGRAVGATAGAEALRDVVTDTRGYARWRVEGDTVRVLRVVAEGASGEALVRPDVPGDAGCLSSAEPDRADLDARVQVPIRTGRVRQVFVETDPRTLTLGPGASAAVRVRMLDSAGALVRDEPVEVSASEGTVTAPIAQLDGSFVALFTPALGTVARDVRITAKSSAGAVVTTLAMAPRPVRGLVSAGFGWVGNFSSISSPYGVIALEPKLPWNVLSARIGVSAYGLKAQVEDATGDAEVTATFFPVDLGLTLASRGPRLSLGAGLSLVVVPFDLSARYDGADALGGVGLSPPGVDARGTVGWRLGQTELFAEVGYLLFTAPDGAVTIAQNAGGLHMIGGYRLLY